MNIGKHRPGSRRRFEEFRREFKAGKTISPNDSPSSADEKESSQPGPEKKGPAYFRQYVRFVSQYWRAALLLIVVAVSIAMLDMLHPLFLRYVLDDVLLDESLTTAQRVRNLQIAGGAFLLVIIVGQALDVFKNFRQKRLNVRVLLSLRRSLYNRMLHLPLEKLSEMKTGGIVSRMTGDIDLTTGLLQMGLISPGVSLIRLFIAIGMLFAVNWQLAILAMAVIPFVMLLSFGVAKRIRPIYRAVRKDVNQVDARVGETFGGIRVVRGFQREHSELAEFLGSRHTIVRKQLFAHRREVYLWGTWSFMLASVSLVAVWYGGYLVTQGKASVGDIMAFQLYTMMLLNPVWNIVNSFSELQRSLAAMERVFEVLDMPTDKPDVPHAIDPPARVENIAFENVEFAYNEGQNVLQDFNIDIPGGSMVALVGRSGAGKTTATDLLARFYDPTDGKITLNGRDIRDYRLAGFRNLLGIVQQETFLFDGTVAENIAYGRPDATEDEVIAAAKRANAHSFIVDLPDDYETIIGERGTKLSGGQAQRLSIARAILADPQILILDEATSNLDTESERLIQSALDHLFEGRTTFVIAHRLSTIRDADMILVIDQGEIAESGTHDELMCAGGLYRDMVDLQQEAMTLQG